MKQSDANEDRISITNLEGFVAKKLAHELSDKFGMSEV